MNGIHSKITGLAIGLWFAPRANGGRSWPCFIELATLPLVGFGMPHIVEVCYGDARQSLIAGEFEQPPGTFTKLFGWRARRACRAVHPVRPEGVGPQPYICV